MMRRPISGVQLLLLIAFALLSRYSFAQKDTLSHTVRYLDGPAQFVDTILDIEDYEEMQTLGYKKRPYLYLSNLGRPEFHLDLRPARTMFPVLGHQALLDQHSTIYDIPFYKVKSPISDIYYYSTINRGQFFGGYFSQNINENWSYYLEYNRMRSEGDYFRQETVNDRTKISLSYKSPNKRYGFHSGLAWDISNNEENGGIVYDTAYSDNTVNFRALMDVNLQNSQVKTRTTTAFFEQDFVFVKTDTLESDDGLSVYHRIEYQEEYFRFRSQDSVYITPALLDSTISRDSTGTRRISNTVGLKGKFQNRNFYLLFKGGVNYHLLSYRNASTQLDEGSLGVEGVVNGNYKNWLQFSGNLHLGLVQQYAGNFIFNLNADFGSWVWGTFHLSNRAPDYIYRNFSGNSYSWNNQSFQNVVTQNYRVGIGYKDYFRPYVGAKSITNYMYWETEASPLQTPEAVTTFEAGATWKVPLSTHWRFDGTLNYQEIASGGDYLSLPDLYGRTKVYYDFSLFERALHAQIGSEYQYVSQFRGMNYLPGLGVYSALSDVEMGPSHILNVFLNVRIQTAQIFVKWENALEGFIPYSNWGAPNHPMTDMAFRFGFKWRFFN